jgi:transcriptional regulator with XRE-family HTH domain
MLPENFKAIRIAMGWTRDELGKILGVGHDYVKAYEEGEAPIPPLLETRMIGALQLVKTAKEILAGKYA